jgi:hypothetical protein
MEDNTIDIILLAILIAIFAIVINMYEQEKNYQLLPLSMQTDNLFNKWRRIY